MWPGTYLYLPTYRESLAAYVQWREARSGLPLAAGLPEFTAYLQCPDRNSA